MMLWHACPTPSFLSFDSIVLSISLYHHLPISYREPLRLPDYPSNLLIIIAMGIFKRKDSKHSIHSDKDEQESYVSVNSARTSNVSLKSPGYKSSGLPSSIPDLPIARPPDPALDPAAYLRSIHAIRDRCSLVHGQARRNRLNHFTVDMSKFSATASYIVSIIKVRG